MRIEVAAATDTGKRRKTNADAFIVDQATGLFAVADGRGDTPRAALVAKMGLEAVQELFQAPGRSCPSQRARPTRPASGSSSA